MIERLRNGLLRTDGRMEFAVRLAILITHISDQKKGVETSHIDAAHAVAISR